MQQTIIISISKFLTNELVRDIALEQWHSALPLWVNRSRQYIFDEIANGNDCFGVLAVTSSGELVGRIHCVQNEQDPSRWYYGDLFVKAEYRRMGIAKQMLSAAITHLTERGASSLCCFVEPCNLASKSLQLSMGFAEREHKPFNGFITDGEIMYERAIENGLSVIPATADEAYFVTVLFAQNRYALHADRILLDEWKTYLSAGDEDERHFLICKGALPVAYMKINGLQNQDEAWISTLVVEKSFQRQKIGTFAIRYAEKYVKERGFDTLAILTDADNLPAQCCYRACGYSVCDAGEKLKFVKRL